MSTLKEAWETSDLRWSLQEYKELSHSPEALLKYAKSLHEQAQNTISSGIMFGAGCGIIIVLVGLFFIAIFAAWKIGDADALRGISNKIYTMVSHVLNSVPLTQDEKNLFGVCFVGGGLLGAGWGFFRANRQAVRLRSMAVMALSLARTEAKLKESDDRIQSMAESIEYIEFMLAQIKSKLDKSDDSELDETDE